METNFSTHINPGSMFWILATLVETLPPVRRTSSEFCEFCIDM